MATIVEADTPLQVVPIDSLAALQSHRAAYDAFIQTLPDSCRIFHSLDWIESMFPLYCPEPGQFLFLLAFKGEQLVGVAPFYFQGSRRLRGLIGKLTSWGAIRASLMVEADLLIPDAANTEECTAAFLDCLFRSGAVKVDCLDLRYLRPETATYDALRRALPGATVTRESMDSYQVDLTKPYAEFLGTRSKSMVQQLARRDRALARDFGYTFEGKDEVNETEWQEIIALHIARQSELIAGGRDRSSLFGDTLSRTCYRSVLEKLAARNLTCFYLLKARGITIAFSIVLRAGPVLIWHLTAFDSAYAKYSPGKLVVLKIIEAEINAGRHSRMDMMPGVTRVKTDFCDIKHPRMRLFAGNTTSLKSMVRYALCWTLVRAKESLETATWKEWPKALAARLRKRA